MADEKKSAAKKPNRKSNVVPMSTGSGVDPEFNQPVERGKGSRMNATVPSGFGSQYPNIPASSAIGKALRGPKGGQVAKAVDELRGAIGKVVAKRPPPDRADIANRVKGTTSAEVTKAGVDTRSTTSRPVQPAIRDGVWTDSRPKSMGGWDTSRTSGRANDPVLADRLNRMEAREARNASFGQAYNTFNRVAAPIGTAVAAAQAFRRSKESGNGTGRAVGDAAVAAAPGVAMMAAPVVSGPLIRGGAAAMKLATEIVPSLTTQVLFPQIAVITGAPTAVLGIGGAAAWGAGQALRIAGRVAAPAMAAYGAYQGAMADSNTARGAVRGAIGALDPTAIVSNLGAATGLMTDHRGLGERAFDAAFGKAGPAGQTRTFNAAGFDKANAAYTPQSHDASSGSGPRGWGDQARINAYFSRQARSGRAPENVPYGGAYAPVNTDAR